MPDNIIITVSVDLSVFLELLGHLLGQAWLSGQPEFEACNLAS